MAEFYDRMIKQTPRCAVASFSVTLSQASSHGLDDTPINSTTVNTVFGIKNDIADSRIAVVVVQASYNPHTGKSRIALSAVPQTMGDAVGKEAFPLVSARALYQWPEKIRALAGRDDRKECMYMLRSFDQKECMDRTTNPYEKLVDRLFARKIIGPLCKKDLMRILSAVNVAADKREGQVDAKQLTHIGDEPPAMHL